MKLCTKYLGRSRIFIDWKNLAKSICRQYCQETNGKTCYNAL